MLPRLDQNNVYIITKIVIWWHLSSIELIHSTSSYVFLIVAHDGYKLGEYELLNDQSRSRSHHAENATTITGRIPAGHVEQTKPHNQRDSVGL